MVTSVGCIIVCYLVLNVHDVLGLAYAPNFITKIISLASGREPVGLLDLEAGGDLNIDSSDQEALLKNNRRHTGPIITRFPPEPNGYLHLGHAKAVSFNFAVARMFPPDGRCHMRLDDTNPSKEEQEYVDSIVEDVRWIQSGCPPFIGAPAQLSTDRGPWYGPVRKTSDYFKLIYDCAVALIKSGDAYVCSLTAEEIKEYRGTLTEKGQESPYRNRSIEENLDIFMKMREGRYKDGEHVLRAKIDMASPNMNMRDPVLFRIKHESHPATGKTWCIYPMYDFSHPIADSVENISHSLCTLEFEDHRPFYDWTIDKLIPTGLLTAIPQQIEFSRLNVKYTVLSKRKLIQLVQGNYVSGWDDPRMPTLSGMRRRGIPPEALRLFCERVGISKSDSFIDVQELENCVREIMDEGCPRAFAILKPLKVTVSNWEGSTLEKFCVPRHPKVSDMGQRILSFGKVIFIERSDFFDLDGPEGVKNGGVVPDGYKRLLPGQMVRLKYAYVIKCIDVVRDSKTQEPIEISCEYYPETRAGVTPVGMPRVNGIVQWVEATSGIKCEINQYERLFNSEEPGLDTGFFLDDLNPDSFQKIIGALVEPSVASDARDTISQVQLSEGHNCEKIYLSRLSYQFERNGYFALDASSTQSNFVFNRVVTLRDNWDVSSKGTKVDQERTRAKNFNFKTPGQTHSESKMIEDVRRVAFRAAKIIDANLHPDADHLVVCKVICGSDETEPRIVVANLAGKLAIDELIGKKVVCVTNLKPSKMKGIDSHGVILLASDCDEGVNGYVELLNVPDDVPVGELCSFEGKDVSEPDTVLKSKGALKVFERVLEALKTNEKKEVIYVQGDKSYRLTSSFGPVTVTSLTNAPIQ